MSTGYGANCADVIDDYNLRAIPECGELLDKLHACFNDDQQSLFPDDDISFERFAEDVEGGGDFIPQELFERAESIYQELQKVFREKTGLELYLGYHNCDEQGDCYDDINGAYFTVAGCYVISPEYKKAKERFGIDIPRVYFVSLG